MKADIDTTKGSEVVYGMVDGAMLQTREGEQNNDWKEVIPIAIGIEKTTQSSVCFMQIAFINIILGRL